MGRLLVYSVAVALLSAFVGASDVTAQTLMPLPAHTGNFSGNVRGYWFTAPVDFTIVGLRVPTDASTAGQTIEVVRFDNQQDPPLWSTTTNAFTSLFRVVDDQTTNILTVNIPVSVGDKIGILGWRGTTNSYASGAPHASTIAGQAVTLTRLGMQFNLNTTPAQDLFQESGGSISRVEMYYDVSGDPEIDVQRPAATSIASGTTDSVGTTLTGTTTSYTYTIENLGASNALNLTGTPLVAISSESNCTATVTTQPSTPVAAGNGTTTFTIDVTSIAAGPYSFTLSIANDDTTGGEDPYTIDVGGTADGPAEIDIQDPNTNSVASGATLTVYAAVAGTSSLGTFTILNTGGLDLNLTGTPLVDVGSSEVNCAVTITQPTTNPVPGAGSDTFGVDVNPTAAGAFSFTVTIVNDDADEGTYTINFAGVAKAAADAEIAVWDFNDANINNGGTISETNTGTALFNRTFTIRNEGGLALNLTGTTEVAVSGESNCTVGINQPASNSLAAAATWLATEEGFSLDITPSAAGAFSFTVTIISNDADEGTFSFTYSGNTATPGTGSGSGGGGGSGGGCSTGTDGFNWLALLGLLGVAALVFRMRSSKA